VVHNAEQTAKNAEADQTNEPGYCLQQCRTWAGIAAGYPDASTAWRNTNDRHPGNRTPPRGSAVYWTGGSKGYGHIAISLGNGKVRSTDAGGAGQCATVSLGWVESHWGLPYAGWAWDINEVTIPHGEEDEVKDEDIEAIAARINHTLGDWNSKGKLDDGVKQADAELGDQRLRQIENVVRDIQDRVKKIEKKV
jgi:hypothetical protein